MGSNHFLVHRGASTTPAVTRPRPNPRRPRDPSPLTSKGFETRVVSRLSTLLDGPGRGLVEVSTRFPLSSASAELKM